VIGQDMINRLYECQVVDPRGEKIGSVKRIWLDGSTGDPVWASVHTGLFGLKESFVPLQRAEMHEDKLQVPVDKDQVKDSPRIEATHDNMTDEEQAALYQHYGFGPQATSPEGGRHQNQRSAGANERTTQRSGADQRAAGMGQPSGMGQGTQRRPGSSQQPGEYPQGARREKDKTGAGSMTRSEEQLKVGTERVETGKVRLVKHVVTEEQQVRVPVSHEEVRLEREPITDANRDEAMRGKPLAEGEHEVTLHAEKAVVNKETVPVEQVRLTKDTVAGEETVSGTIRKEEIEVEDGREKRDNRRR
jgi:uncharacterized protein (TIGR02271 family)